MDTTTVRVDTETHARLQALSKESGRSLVETLREAAEALSKQRFAHQVEAELAELRADEDSWRAYLAEADATSVSDGIDR